VLVSAVWATVRAYLAAGVFRNLLGFVVFLSLNSVGFSITEALLMTMTLGIFFYFMQVRITIGAVAMVEIFLGYAVLFILNRLLLWLLHQQGHLPLAVVQFFCMLTLSVLGYFFMRHRAKF